jgi:hypothetical protein
MPDADTTTAFAVTPEFDEIATLLVASRADTIYVPSDDTANPTYAGINDPAACANEEPAFVLIKIAPSLMSDIYKLLPFDEMATLVKEPPEIVFTNPNVDQVDPLYLLVYAFESEHIIMLLPFPDIARPLMVAGAPVIAPNEPPEFILW